MVHQHERILRQPRFELHRRKHDLHLDHRRNGQHDRQGAGDRQQRGHSHRDDHRDPLLVVAPAAKTTDANTAVTLTRAAIRALDTPGPSARAAPEGRSAPTAPPGAPPAPGPPAPAPGPTRSSSPTARAILRRQLPHAGRERPEGHGEPAFFGFAAAARAAAASSDRRARTSPGTRRSTERTSRSRKSYSRCSVSSVAIACLRDCPPAA